MAHSTLLLDAHLKALRLPTFLREYDTVARHCAQEGLDCPRYLFRLCELELLDREQRATERRIKAAKFPVLKSLETFAFRAIPSVNKRLVLELARSAYLDRRENVLALGNSGTGKTHLALALGLAACQKGYRVRFITAAALVNELLEARDEKRLLRVQKQLAKQDLLIVDELGYVPLSKTGAELLFEIFSQRYEQASTLVTSNLLAFRGRALVQRCQWHKRENVVSYLAKNEQAMWRQRLQRAYNRPDYAEALGALETLHGELDERNQSAADSLAEGLDETLTLHRLGVYGVLGRSLKTTNCLESVNALVEERCAKVDHWQSSSQRHRWLATALLDIEPRLRRIRGYRHLPTLRDALKRELKIETTTSEKQAA